MAKRTHPFARQYGPPQTHHALDNFEETLTQQSAVEDADINNIIKRIMRGELYDNFNKYEPHYGDYSDFASDYHAALNLVLQAQESFAELPAAIRDRFDNDPEAFLRFMDDPDNLDEAIELGIVERREDVAVPSDDAPPPPSGDNEARP